jgi:hypothetical protein
LLFVISSSPLQASETNSETLVRQFLQLIGFSEQTTVTKATFIDAMSAYLAKYQNKNNRDEIDLAFKKNLGDDKIFALVAQYISLRHNAGEIENAIAIFSNGPINKLSRRRVANSLRPSSEGTQVRTDAQFSTYDNTMHLSEISLTLYQRIIQYNFDLFESLETDSKKVSDLEKAKTATLISPDLRTQMSMLARKSFDIAFSDFNDNDFGVYCEAIASTNQRGFYTDVAKAWYDAFAICYGKAIEDLKG